MSETIKTLISGHQLFAGLDPQHIESLAKFATEQQIPAGQILFSQSEPARNFYVIVSGTVIVETPALYGPTLVLQELGPGKILGWSWLIPPYRWHFQARAEVESDVLEFDGAGLLALCEEDSEFGYQLLKRFASLMGDRLESARRRMIPPGIGATPHDGCLESGRLRLSYAAQSCGCIQRPRRNTQNASNAIIDSATVMAAKTPRAPRPAVSARYSASGI